MMSGHVAALEETRGPHYKGLWDLYYEGHGGTAYDLLRERGLHYEIGGHNIRDQGGLHFEGSGGLHYEGSGAHILRNKGLH